MTEDIPDLKYCSYKVFVHWRMYYETNGKLCSGAVLLGEISAPPYAFPVFNSGGSIETGLGPKANFYSPGFMR